MPLEKIVSGGQTGVDRGALDAALEREFPCGGRCPAGRRAEDGAIPDRYPLTELDTESYRRRTVANIVESDATVVIYFDRLEGGTGQTVLHCVANHKPHRLIDGAAVGAEEAVKLIHEFIETNDVAVLNIAGPRLSKEPRAHAYSYDMVLGLIDSLG